MKKMLIASVGLLAFAGVAQAADAVSEVPSAPAAEEVSQVFTWSGPYFGIQGGGAWMDADVSGATGGTTVSLDGGILGAFVGYNWQFSNGFVAGIEGDADYNWNEETLLGPVEMKTDWAGSVRGRVGYAFDRALVYGAAGWTGTNFKLSGGGVDEEETYHGWTVGAGVDYAFTDKMFGRVEYRYNDFGGKDILGLDFDLNHQHVVKVGLGVKF
jgi:outer membrane immunogenic protein